MKVGLMAIASAWLTYSGHDKASLAMFIAMIVFGLIDAANNDNMKQEISWTNFGRRRNRPFRWADYKDDEDDR